MSTGNGTILARASPPTLDNADKPIKQTPDKQAVLQTVSVMKNKRTTYEKRWKSIRDYQLPFLGVFSDTADESDRGRRRDTEIANGVAWLSNQAFAAGVMSGLTPPSRQWFKFGFSDGTEGDVEAEQVLDERQAILEAFLHRSNFYNSIHTIYMELPFGQAPLGVFSSPQTGIRFQPYTIGTYYLGANGSGQINTFARRIQMTARDVMERQQEKLQQLGPVVERLQDEFLSPIIERTYNILERMGAFPPISDDLLMRMQDKEIKIEYISPLAQAQKMSGLVNIEQALSFVGQMVQLYPEVRNMVDPLGTTRRYFELLGAPASMQRPEEEVQAIMKQEQQAMQEQQQMQAQQQMAQTAAPAAQAAKNLTEAANDGNPALTQLLGMGTPEG